MSITEIKGDALDFANQNGFALIHCCNAQGKMGSGIAKQIKTKFPNAYKEYMQSHSLGSLSCDDLSNPSIINMVAQKYYGNDGKKYINYGVLANCLSRISSSGINTHTIVVPKLMGCGLAGGRWDVVEELVIGMLGDRFNILIVDNS